MKIPGYRVERRVGEGGMATVYLAIQESLDRPVALKVLNAVLTDDEKYSRRFLDEGRIIAALRHSNIITIYDVGVAAGIHYISMEFVEGGDLKRRMAQTIPPAEAVDLVRKIGSALDFAHRAGVIHRDVKPANILFRSDGTPLLTDFGIAKRLQSDATLTRTVFGTPGYLSPEQAQGKPVDGRSDIYSLGVILYEMLAGKRPFEADSEIATILRQLEEPVPDLPAPVRRFQPLLEQMMAKEPADRLPDAAAVLRRIDELREGGVESPAPSRRTWVVAAGVGAALAAGVAGALIATHYLDRAGTEPAPAEEAVAPVSAATADAAESARQATVEPTTDSTVAEVERLNALAIEALAEDQLVSPRDGSAFGYFQEALKLDAGNPIAMAGLAEIVSRLTASADAALAGRDAASARELAGFGLEVEPADARLQELAARADEILARIESLLSAGTAALSADRLTTPRGDNALEHFDAVLELDPDNEPAKEGKSRIAQRYARLAEAKIDGYQYADARELIRRGLEVQPGDPHLLSLRDKAQIKSAPGQVIDDIKGFFD